MGPRLVHPTRHGQYSSSLASVKYRNGPDCSEPLHLAVICHAGPDPMDHALPSRDAPYQAISSLNSTHSPVSGSE